MQTQDQILQNWINNFEDIYNKYPPQETIQYWKSQIADTYWNKYDDEDYQ
jgi:hypothetical protein